MDMLGRVRRKKVLCFLLTGFWLLAVGPAPAQRSELGFGVGGSFYMGEINPKRVFYKTRFAGSLFYRYNFDTRMALRAGASYGQIMAFDEDFGNPRGLNFKSDLWEVSALLEVNFLNFFTGSHQHRITPYLTFGAAMAVTDPEGRWTNPHTGSVEWVPLRPLRTEGQEEAYSRFQFVVPMGLGVKFSVCRFMSIGVEWTMRLAFTDYLDDVGGTYANTKDWDAQRRYFADPEGVNDDPDDPARRHLPGSRRGDAGTYDWYSFAMFTVSFRLPGKDVPCPAYDGLQKKKKR